MRKIEMAMAIVGTDNQQDAEVKRLMKWKHADLEAQYNKLFENTTKEENTMTTFVPATDRLPEIEEKHTAQTTWEEKNVTSTNPENTPAPVETSAPVKEKEVPHAVVAQGLTGAYTNDLEFLAHIVQDAIPEVMRTSFTIHADPKKKKLMVRWSGKSMLFKVFIQRKCYKVHLKKATDWDIVPFEHGVPFFQNGFNLPWAVKMNDDQFAQFLQWIFTTV